MSWSVRWSPVPAAALVVAGEVAFGPYAAPVFSALAAGTVLAAMALERRLEAATLLVVVLAFVFPHSMDVSVLLRPVRVYPVDLLAMVMMAAAALRLWRARTLPPLWRHVGVILLVCLTLTAWGLARGNPSADALGTLRRIGFYGSMTLVGTTAFMNRPLDWRALRRLFIVGGGLVVAVGLWRLVTGEGFRQDYFEAAGVPSRYLSYLEALTALGASLMVLEAPNSNGGRRNLALRWGFFLLLVAALVVSNYRGVWLALVVGLAVREAVRRRRHLGRLMAGAAGLAAAAGIATAALTVLRPGSSPLARFSLTNLRRGVSWRSASWSEAFDHFLANPLVGDGFGYVHRFTFMAGPRLDHAVYVVGRSIHNDVLWLMANGGILLLVAVLSLHARWVVTLLRAAGDHREPNPTAGMAAALVGFLAGLWVVALLQPLLSHPSTAVALHLLLGATWTAAAGARGATTRPTVATQPHTQ